MFDICLLQYVQSLTPDDGRNDRPKHVECYSNKINWDIDVSDWFCYRNILRCTAIWTSKLYKIFSTQRRSLKKAVRRAERCRSVCICTHRELHFFGNYHFYEPRISFVCFLCTPNTINRIFPKAVQFGFIKSYKFTPSISFFTNPVFGFLKYGSIKLLAHATLSQRSVVGNVTGGRFGGDYYTCIIGELYQLRKLNFGLFFIS